MPTKRSIFCHRFWFCCCVFYFYFSCWVFKQKRMNNCSFTRSLSSSVSPKVFFPHMYVLLVVLSVLIGLVTMHILIALLSITRPLAYFRILIQYFAKKYTHSCTIHLCACVCVCFHMKTNTQMQWQSIYLLYPVVNIKSIMSGMTKASHGSS